MSMQTYLPGRLKNTSLPKSHGLMPLFEAVINSIHSIEEAGLSSMKGKIAVEILRSQKQLFDPDDSDKKLGAKTCDDIIGFKITDNGIGFNDKNMESFETLDSDHKADKGCRGVGRLLWLKAFRRVEIESIFRTNKSDEGDKKVALKKRTFVFNSETGVSKPVVADVLETAARQTCVHLDGFVKRYQQASRKMVRAIANNLFEHCLWYFVRVGGAPSIIIRDAEESVNLEEVYDEHMHSHASGESLLIKDNDFSLTHVRLKASSSQSNIIAFCAGNRLVKEENLNGKIPGLYGRINDGNGDFVYACYVCSDFLDDAVRSERTGFDIAEDADDFFGEKDLSFPEIREAIINKSKEHLSEYIEINKAKGKQRIEKFVSQKAPRYRPILSRIPDDRLNIDPTMSDKELELTLHKHLYEIEEKQLADGHDLMQPMPNEELAEYEKRLQEYLDTAEDIKKSDLANYVSHRKVILDILSQAIKRDADGKYACEDLIHKLIMPMRKESNDIIPDGCNLWLVDERLAFHDYLASDKTLLSMPVTGSTETKEPDIFALNVFDNPTLISEGERLPLGSIEIIEIKRPMRNDASQGEEKDPIEQALGYLDRIRKGGVTTASGRPILGSEVIPGFCYIICDITPSIKKRCELHDATRTSDGSGYFFYHKNYKAYVEVISFDGLVNSAKERNRAFFAKLGLPAT